MSCGIVPAKYMLKVTATGFDVVDRAVVSVRASF